MERLRGSRMNQSLLQNVYLFKTMSSLELGAVNEICESKTLAAGDTIFSRGEAAKALYLIKYGSVKIQQTISNGDSVEIATLGEGSHFGEMAFVDGEARSASALAAERTELITVPYAKLSLLLEKNMEIAVKFYHELAHFLCRRLRVTTNDLSFVREKNLSHF